MRSDTIDESGVNVFIFAVALGSGTCAASNQSKQMRTNRAAYDRSNRAGQRQYRVRSTNFIYYFLTISAAQRESRPPPILTACMREASPAENPARLHGNCNSPINAFLTLAAVTKW